MEIYGNECSLLSYFDFNDCKMSRGEGFPPCPPARPGNKTLQPPISLQSVRRSSGGIHVIVFVHEILRHHQTLLLEFVFQNMAPYFPTL